MVKVLSPLLLVVSAIMGGQLLYFSGTNEESKLEIEALHGDFIFRQGKGLWSPYFAGLNSTTGFSHVGVVIGSSDSLHVLHADADDISQKGGVKKTPLQQFVNDSLTVSIKHNHMPDKMKVAFVKHLELMHEEQIEFDGDFDVHDNGEQVYCTEYLWIAALRAGVSDIGEVESILGKDLILVDSIYRSHWLN